MRRRSRRVDTTSDEAVIDMTPMMDIVFIMLIFFIVTTSFVRESGIEINRPSANTSEKKSSSNIIVAIKSNGEVWIDKRSIDINAVRAHVERLHAENPQGTVVIAADKESRTGDMIKVLDQVRAAGVMDAAIATEEGGG